MLPITTDEIKSRIAFDNPWWLPTTDPAHTAWRARLGGWKERAFLDGFHALVTLRSVNRAPVLMGPRRVGKTVMLLQTIKRLIDSGVAPRQVCYVSVDNPVYVGLGLERFLTLFRELHDHRGGDDLYVFFDEIQYLKDWERHLKSLVDSYPSMRFVASVSAAALKVKSVESGAGRFSDFLLPPLTFAEFLDFRDIPLNATDAQLDSEVVDYVNFGGFPETVLGEDARHNMSQFIANDVIDKVLLRDLPSLYGIRDQNDLKRLFAVIAYNTGQEVDLDGLSKQSGISKNTLRSYLEYLEAAFLIHRLFRIDASARRFVRATTFKLYLANPSLRAALFGATSESAASFGYLAETAFAAHIAATQDWRNFFYARWPAGEIDFVQLFPDRQAPWIAFEVKWSDRDTGALLSDSPGLMPFLRRNDCPFGVLVTKGTGVVSERNALSDQGRPIRILRHGLAGILARGITTYTTPFDRFGPGDFASAHRRAIEEQLRLPDRGGSRETRWSDFMRLALVDALRAPPRDEAPNTR